jgi:hypothetical protein
LHIYTCHRQRGLAGPLRCEGYHPYINCPVYGARMETCGTPASIFLGVDMSPSTETL